MRRAVCPGSFDPVTNGHLDIVERAASLFDEVVVAVGVNQSKHRLFTADERLAMLRRAVGHLPNVSVEGFTGLLTTFCAEHDIQAIVKGLRAVSDFDYELQMAQMNASLTEVETVFVPTSPEWSFLASSLVKEVASFGGDVSGLVPDFVHEALVARVRESHPRGVSSTLRFAAATRGWIRCPLICCARNRKWTPEQTGPESAARARYTRARSPPGVPARGGADGAGPSRSGHRGSPCPRRCAGRARPAPRGGHGGRAGHGHGASRARG